MEEEEEEERRQRQQKDEEDFTKLPEEADEMTHLEDAAADQLNDVDPTTVKDKKKKKKKRREMKTKDNDENLVTYTGDPVNSSAMGNTTQGLMEDANSTGEHFHAKDLKKSKKAYN